MIGEKFAQMGEITIMGILIVFLALIIIWASIEIMHFFVTFFEKRKKSDTAGKAASQPKEAPVPAPAPVAAETEDEELIAVITAAIAASLGTSTYNLKIKSFRRVGASAPVWNTVSRRQENL